MPPPTDPQPPVKYPSLPSKLILTSTKSYFSPTRTIKYVQDLLTILPNYSHPDLLFALIPDHLTIYPISQLLTQSTTTTPSPSTWPLHLGAQDCSPFPTYGPYTGFTSPLALSSLGCTIIELGHAERRRHASETNTLIATKAAAVSSLGMIPLVCIGEASPPPTNPAGPLSMSIGNAMLELTPQITTILSAIPPSGPLIFAYEPIWAIGATQPASVEYIAPIVSAIRAVAFQAAPSRTSENTKVVYGGSAGPGLWSGATNGGNGLGQYVDGMFLGRFAHEIGGVEKVLGEVVESLKGSHR